MIYRLSIILAFILYVSAETTKGQTGYYWIFLQDKDQSLPPALSPERLQERQSIGLTVDDYPVNPAYLKALRESGVNIRHTSRWLNAVSAEGNLPEAVLNLPFVRDVQPFVCGKLVTASQNSEETIGFPLSQAQERMNIPFLRKKGCKGKGVKIAVFDDGFKYARNAPNDTRAVWFKKMKIRAHYDFVNKQTDVFHSGTHGTHVSALIGGQKGKERASAYKATFYLARTEDNATERNIEEDNWVAAAEWADSIGVDLIHTSLNYAKFDEGEKRQYTDSDKNGTTAVITRAANKAFERGIIVVCSAGNEGIPSKETTICPPCDAFGSVCVGSIKKDGRLSYFSSVGPTADGRIKPDVVSFGDELRAFGTYFGDGTSYAAPQVSGMLGAVIGKFRNLSDEQVRRALLQSGHLAQHPNNKEGYGLPDGKRFWEKLRSAKGKIAR
jgi:subtilisin family serine protease